MILIYLLLVQFASSLNVIIEFDSKNVASEVDPSFISVAYKGSYLRHPSSQRSFDSLRYRTLAGSLAREGKMYARQGGGSADLIEFDANFIHYNRTVLNNVLGNTQRIGWRLVFGLNGMERYPDKSWNPTNTYALLKYLKSLNYFDIDFELSNEFDLYPKYKNFTLLPEQLVKDESVLRQMLDDLGFTKSTIIGPNVATTHRYEFFQKYLRSSHPDVVGAISFHQYYSSSVNITAQNFTDSNYLDKFLLYSSDAVALIKQEIGPRFTVPPIWIGETSSTYGGGVPGLGSSYAAGFLWLDKLGLAAQLNISVLIKQCFFGGHYSLVEYDSHADSYNPTASYYIAKLHKHLFGTRVLNVTGFLQQGRKTRIYAHCARDLLGVYPPGSVVFSAINVHNNEPVYLRVGDQIDIDLYLFTPANGDITDTNVALNGKVLKMIDDNTLPYLDPVHTQFPIKLPPLTYAIFVVPYPIADACKKN